MELAFPWPYSQGEWMAFWAAAATCLAGLVLLLLPRLALALLAPGAWIRNRHSRQQRFGIRMARRTENAFPFGQFHNLAEINHRHPMTDVLHDADIVGNEQI